MYNKWLWPIIGYDLWCSRLDSSLGYARLAFSWFKQTFAYDLLLKLLPLFFLLFLQLWFVDVLRVNCWPGCLLARVNLFDSLLLASFYLYLFWSFSFFLLKVTQSNENRKRTNNCKVKYLIAPCLHYYA